MPIIFICTASGTGLFLPFVRFMRDSMLLVATVLQGKLLLDRVNARIVLRENGRQYHLQILSEYQRRS